MSEDETRGSAAGPAAVAGAARPRYGEVIIRDRGRLPHWEKDAGLYFITFRLADSLPEHVIEAMAVHRMLLEEARSSGRAFLPAEIDLRKKSVRLLSKVTLIPAMALVR